MSGTNVYIYRKNDGRTEYYMHYDGARPIFGRTRGRAPVFSAVNAEKIVRQLTQLGFSGLGTLTMEEAQERQRKEQQKVKPT